MLMQSMTRAVLTACVLLGGSTVWAAPNTSKATAAAPSSSWNQYYAQRNQYRISFPESPEHMQQTLSSGDSYDMKYDVYVAANQQREVYMVLVAQYPEFVDDSYAELSLETFLNGILQQNPGNQLIFADLTDVQGFKALDFFIRSKDNVYFKGRAIMAQNQLYLLAMECEVHNYVESNYNYFVNSFQIVR